MFTLRNMADLRKLLKTFGTIIYTGDREADLELMKEELTELYQLGMLEKEDYYRAIRILLSESEKGGFKGI